MIRLVTVSPSKVSPFSPGYQSVLGAGPSCAISCSMPSVGVTTRSSPPTTSSTDVTRTGTVFVNCRDEIVTCVVPAVEPDWNQPPASSNVTVSPFRLSNGSTVWSSPESESNEIFHLQPACVNTGYSPPHCPNGDADV